MIPKWKDFYTQSTSVMIAVVVGLVSHACETILYVVTKSLPLIQFTNNQT